MLLPALVGPWWDRRWRPSPHWFVTRFTSARRWLFRQHLGVVLAGLAYRHTRNIYFTAVGEIIGTGLIGASVGTLVAPYLMGKQIALTVLILPFLLSSIAGAILGIVVHNLATAGLFAVSGAEAALIVSQALGYGYPAADKQVLHDLNFTIAAGESAYGWREQLVNRRSAAC